MYTLPSFCRVCLKSDKNLIDLEHLENEPNESLLSKLQHCVSEVEWSVFKPLLCHPCIKRLNVAYTFKKQCVQSATVLKSYIALVEENRKKTEAQATSSEIAGPAAIITLPNQKFIKIIVGTQNQNVAASTTVPNTFQNVFVNVVPTTTTISPIIVPSDSGKDTNNQNNVFHNINNTFQKFIPPIVPIESKDVNQLLTDSKTEEVSIEVDPLDFNIDAEEGSEKEEGEETLNDWEELISISHIANKHKSNGAATPPTEQTNNSNNVLEPKYTNFVPILPKQDTATNIQHQENKMYFFNSGEHFLSSVISRPELLCELCDKLFNSIRLLKVHINDYHMGKNPFKCEYCYTEFLLRSEYEDCVKSHKLETDQLLHTSLTLKDFKPDNALNGKDDELLLPPVDPDPQPEDDLKCRQCRRQFHSQSGLLRHKVRKHSTQNNNKKKYFIKGMKNAKCDICNREFSTQSYMQLHRKLHLRDDIGYKYKVFGKNRYVNGKNTKNNGAEKDGGSESENEDKSKVEDNSLNEEKKEQDSDSDGGALEIIEPETQMVIGDNDDDDDNVVKQEDTSADEKQS